MKIERHTWCAARDVTPRTVAVVDMFYGGVRKGRLSRNIVCGRHTHDELSTEALPQTYQPCKEITHSTHSQLPVRYLHYALRSTHTRIHPKLHRHFRTGSAITVRDPFRLPDASLLNLCAPTRPLRTPETSDPAGESPGSRRHEFPTHHHHCSPRSPHLACACAQSGAHNCGHRCVCP